MPRSKTVYRPPSARPSTRRIPMAKPDVEYGLLIERVEEYGSEKVTVHVVRRREADGNVPLGCSGDGESYLGYGCSKHLLGLVVDGLGMYGFVSDSDGQ